jgi:hypothetical protein
VFVLKVFKNYDIFFRAKKHHEETVLSLKDAHENEVGNLQQQVNQLSSQNKMLENEVETLRNSRSKYDQDQLFQVQTTNCCVNLIFERKRHFLVQCEKPFSIINNSFYPRARRALWV